MSLPVSLPVVLPLAVLLAAGLTVVTASEPVASASRGATAGQGDDGPGAALYARDCAFCHGVDGEGTRQGVPIEDAGEAGARYVLVSGRMPITDPDDPVTRREPPYDDAEIDALVEHVAGLGAGPDLPATDLEGADLGTGGRLYRLQCAGCHGATGSGGSLAYDELAPALGQAEPEVTAAAIVAGPGAMPSFRPGAFSDEDIAAIVAYVGHLRDPDDPGGLPLGRLGRVDEGLVAWGVGAAALLVAAGLIGRRTRTSP